MGQRDELVEAEVEVEDMEEEKVIMNDGIDTTEYLRRRVVGRKAGKEGTEVQWREEIRSIALSSDTKELHPATAAVVDPICLFPRSMYQPLCLCSISDAPLWQTQLAGINRGYRTTRSFQEAFMSLFYWHNESMNVWIHYLGTLLLIWRGYHYGALIWEHNTTVDALLVPSAQATGEKIFLIISIVAGCICPIFFSALCHHFYCISQEWHKLFWFLDFFGILSGITWGALNFIFLAFYTNVFAQIFLTTCIVLGKLYAIYRCWTPFSRRMDSLPLQPRDRMPEFSFVLSSFSAFAYSLTILPTLYFHSKEYFNHPALFEVAMKSCLFPVGMALGIVVFAQGHFPERYASVIGLTREAFDFFGHSHQCWHVLSFLLLFYSIEVTFQHYIARVSNL